MNIYIHIFSPFKPVRCLVEPLFPSALPFFFFFFVFSPVVTATVLEETPLFTSKALVFMVVLKRMDLVFFSFKFAGIQLMLTPSLFFFSASWCLDGPFLDVFADETV